MVRVWNIHHWKIPFDDKPRAKLKLHNWISTRRRSSLSKNSTFSRWSSVRNIDLSVFSSTFRLSSYYRSSCLILCLTLEALRSLTWIYNKTSDICNFDLFTPIHQIGVSLKPVGRIVINTLLFHSTSHFWNFCRYTAIDVSFKPVGRIVIKVGGI